MLSPHLSFSDSFLSPYLIPLYQSWGRISFLTNKRLAGTKVPASLLFAEKRFSAEYYFAIFSQKFMRICATSARVAVPAGSSTPLPLPESRPALTAQSIASRAQSEIAP